MTFEELRAIENEAERVNATYDIFNENARLSSKSARVEFINTVKFVEKYLKSGDRILDIGAGAGEYSIYFANKGFDVDALELSNQNIRDFKAKMKPEMKPEMKLTLTQGNALDLSMYEDETYDIVLLMGPLYHLKDDKDKKKAIEEAKRVCKKEGIIAFAFITHDMIFMTELSYNDHYFATGDYDHETMRLNDFPFVFKTVEESRRLLEECGIVIKHAVAVDGPSELMADKINAMNDEEYRQYLKYVDMICEKPDMLGMSNHLLYIGKKHEMCPA